MISLITLTISGLILRADGFYMSNRPKNSYPYQFMTTMSYNPWQNLFGFGIAKKSSGAMPRKRIAITGASGSVGSRLVSTLSDQGFEVIKITTKEATNDNELNWNPNSGDLDSSKLEGLDAVINLAGENIAKGEGPLGDFLVRWSNEKKEKILSSRIESTRLLVSKLKSLKNKPKVLISASAVGYYGYNDFETIYDESVSSKGTGFLADVCDKWEAEAFDAKKAGIRTVCMRIAPVMTFTAGVLRRLIPLFNLGGGGVIGNGKQVRFIIE